MGSKKQKQAFYRPAAFNLGAELEKGPKQEVSLLQQYEQKKP